MDQIATWKPGQPVPRLTTQSSRDEWAATAKELFENKKFSQAVFAFERAGLSRQRDVAQAYHLRELARQQSTSGSQQVEAFREAARAFCSAAEATNKTREAKVYFRICAECYVRAGDHDNAGKFYERASEYTLSAKNYRVGGCFDDAVRLAKTHEQEIEPSVRENVVEISKLYYLKSGALT